MTIEKNIYVLLQVDRLHTCAVCAFSNLETAIAARDERNKRNQRNDFSALDHYARVEHITLFKGTPQEGE